ncbi:hypothetical protein HAX54_051258 [Datura stramonium]|uniref:Uncharacterized protein n=1 Tax=Datura stramonium TaxID=4076 RepID=A0ABS8RRM0_DATST|nr:hypothetical protein [Datura stramonium]
MPRSITPGMRRTQKYRIAWCDAQARQHKQRNDALAKQGNEPCNAPQVWRFKRRYAEQILQHVAHVTRERACLVYILMTRMPINVGVLIKNLLKRARVNKGQNFGFGDLLTRFLRGHDIEEEEVDCKPYYDPRRIYMTKTKEPKGINGLVLSFNECNVRIDNMLSHLYGMQMLQLRMNGMIEEQLQQLNMDYPLSEHSRALCRAGPGYEEPLDDDVAKEDEMTRIDSDIESSDDNEEDSEMERASLAPINDED